MRGQPGPCLALGNYPAARRYVRGRKPPPIILWSIGIITCLLFMGAVAMLTIGYLNPFGTVGLAILGVGAVVYFGAILFLVLSCLWVERKYPGMPPLSFKIYSRKPNRVPPATFTNPNISGQMPADTTPSYRTHNELPIQVPGFNDVKIKTDKPKEKEDDNHSSHGSSPSHADNFKGQSTALDMVQEEDHNGGISEDDSPDIRHQAQTNNDDVNMNERTKANLISAAGTEEKSQSQEQLKTKHDEVSAESMDQYKTAQHKQSKNDNSVSASPNRERKVKFKTHHIEVPLEDYPSSDSSTSQSNKQDKSQEPNPKDNSQQIRSTAENDNSPTTGASKSASPTKVSAMDKQKEASSSVNNLTHAKDNNSHQRTKTAALSTVIDIKQESSNPSSTQKSRFIENNETLQNGSRLPSSSKPAGSSPATTRKHISGKHENNQESPQKVRRLIPTNSASPPAFRKTSERESQSSRPTNSVLTSKSSPLSARKLLTVPKNNATNPDHTRESVQEKSQASSLLDTGENMLPHKNNLRHDQQNRTSLKHRTQNPESPGGSPTCVQKMQSPERTQKIRKDNAVPNSPPINRKADGSSPPPSYHQKRADHFSKAQVTQKQSITIQTFSSRGKKEDIQEKKILHPSPSSQSSNIPSSSSSSPSRQRQRSPNKSPRLPRNGDHTSSLRNKEFSDRQNRHTSPSSQSRDIPSSPSSSPQRNQRKSPVLSTKIQSHKEIPITSVVSPSSNTKDELHKRLSQQSSQSSDVSSSPTSTPLNATKLLQYKKEQANQPNENKSVPQQRTSK